MNAVGHLAEPQTGPAAQALFEEDLHDLGFVMNASRLWAYHPELVTGLFDLMRDALAGAPVSRRAAGIVVTACASTVRDSYCSLAWGAKLAAVAGEAVAAGVLTGDDGALAPDEQALAAWVRQLVSAPNTTAAADVQRLHAAGFDDEQVFALTVFAALRLAFSTVNAALGVGPDAELLDRVPRAVRTAVDYGRQARPRVG